VMRSFQRSFKLPSAAVAGSIHATYSDSDGGLVVQIPRDRSSDNNRDGMKSFTLGSQDEGSQTTITIASDGAVDAFPMLQEMHEAFFGSPAMQKVELPAAGFLSSQPSSASDDSNKKTLQAAPIKPPNKKAPLVVQRKDAKPFWRLTGGNGSKGRSYIEVVVPEGVQIGELNGKQIPFHGNVEGQLELPVSISSSDCVHVDGRPSTEQVIQCKIQETTVKRVEIKVRDDL